MRSGREGAGRGEGAGREGGKEEWGQAAAHSIQVHCGVGCLYRLTRGCIRFTSTRGSVLYTGHTHSSVIYTINSHMPVLDIHA